jgi:AcrR family transcriptional regulator
MPTPRIERLNTARIAEILSVALDEFASYRYREASFNRIIKSCKMAKGTMYYYFSSKEDLFLTIHKGTLREFRHLILHAQNPINSRTEFWDLARDLVTELARILSRKPTISQFVTNFLTRESRKDGHPAISTVSAIESWMQSFLERGQAVGALRSDLSQDHLLHLAWGLWEISLSWLPRDDKPGSVDPSQILGLFERAMEPAANAVRTERTAAADHLASC